MVLSLGVLLGVGLKSIFLILTKIGIVIFESTSPGDPADPGSLHYIFLRDLSVEANDWNCIVKPLLTTIAIASPNESLVPVYGSTAMRSTSLPHGKNPFGVTYAYFPDTL